MLVGLSIAGTSFKPIRSLNFRPSSPQQMLSTSRCFCRSGFPVTFHHLHMVAVTTLWSCVPHPCRSLPPGPPCLHTCTRRPSPATCSRTPQLLSRPALRRIVAMSNLYVAYRLLPISRTELPTSTVSGVSQQLRVHRWILEHRHSLAPLWRSEQMRRHWPMSSQATCEQKSRANDSTLGQLNRFPYD